MLLSIDASLRSTGFVVFYDDGQMNDYGVINTSIKKFPVSVGYEPVINNIAKHVKWIISFHDIDTVVIEGLSLGSKSKVRDAIDGLHWTLRCSIVKDWPDVLIGVVPVFSWRNWLLPKEIRNKKNKKKNQWPTIKDLTFYSLPIDIQEEFIAYVAEFNLKYDAIYDMADAYGLGLYRLSLDKK